MEKNLLWQNAKKVTLVKTANCLINRLIQLKLFFGEKYFKLLEFIGQVKMGSKQKRDIFEKSFAKLVQNEQTIVHSNLLQ